MCQENNFSHNVKDLLEHQNATTTQVKAILSIL